MTDLYVSPLGSDTNSGSQEAPFQTILQASAAAKPGTTVHVAPGTYEGGFETTADGTASDPIRYVSDTKWGAKIVPAADSTYNTAWNNVGDHVTIDGFEVDGSNIQGGTPWMFGLYTSGTDSAVINNKVHDIARHDAALNDGNGGSAIGGDGYNGDTDISVLNNVVYNIGPANGTNDLIHGIYLTTNGDIKNNMVYQVDSAGIHLWHDAHDVNIVNNTVFASGSGVLVGAGDFVNSQAPNDNTVVANNIIYDNDYGISEQGLTGTHNTYANNLVFKNGTDWRLQNGMTHTDTIAADPQFVDYQRDGSGDYRLAADSPAIDAGTADGAPAADLDGTARTQGSGSDIGAYEFSQAPQDPAPTPGEPEIGASDPEAGASDPGAGTEDPAPAPGGPETGPSEPAHSGEWRDGGTIGRWIHDMAERHAPHGTAGTDPVDASGMADRIGNALGDNFQDLCSRLEAKGGEGIDDALAWVRNFSLSNHVENMTLRPSEGTDTAIGDPGNAARDGYDGAMTHGSGDGLPAGGDGHGFLAYGDQADPDGTTADPAAGGDTADQNADAGSSDAAQALTQVPTQTDDHLAITLQQDGMHPVGGMDLDGTTVS